MFLLLSFKISLHVLDTYSLLGMCVANIVSQAVATLIFLIVYLTEQNILILMNPTS